MKFNYKHGFWLMWAISIFVMTFSYFTIIHYVNETIYYQEYAQLTCEGFNVELDFIKEIYPTFAEKQCEDVRVVIDNQTKADAMCEQIKTIKWPDRIDCQGALE